jgi:hypothetical protein
MDTDTHGLRTDELSVCICVHPWLKLVLSVSGQAERRAFIAARKIALMRVEYPLPYCFNHASTSRSNRLVLCLLIGVWGTGSHGWGEMNS